MSRVAHTCFFGVALRVVVDAYFSKAPFVNPVAAKGIHLACVAFCLYRLIQLKEDTNAWLPPVPKGISPASFAHLRQGLQHFIIGHILSPQFGEIPNLKDSPSELEAILRTAA